MEIEMDEVEVMYVKSDSGPKGSSEAFDQLESKLSNLKGRKFYGIIFGTPPNLEYWASVAIMPSDNPEEMELSRWTIPSGKYAQVKLKDWNHHLEEVPQLFSQLVKANEIDTTRPSIEFYRSMGELILRVPIN